MSDKPFWDKQLPKGHHTKQKQRTIFRFEARITTLLRHGKKANNHDHLYINGRC